MSAIEIYLIFSMFAVTWLDLSKYLIPNWITGSLLLLYPVAVWMTPHPIDWKMAVAAMALVLAIGYGIFCMKWMGGGDIKLLTACTLWVGMKNLPDFMIYVTMIGGGMSLLVLFLRKAPDYIPQLLKIKMPRVLQDGAPIPYGIAIAAGFMIMMWNGMIPLFH
jgi:prepilin peptidase CpaA